jgi:RNA polymerase sigma factor (sigma-70 family)
MANPDLRTLIRRLVSAQGRSVPDQHMLERFIAHQDEEAFAALVERHGGMVLGVARDVLRHLHDAEDIFQATFLVLARQAGAVRKQGSVGSFLHGVAYRLALKARTAAATRRRHESRLPARPKGESLDNLTWQELSAILHQELERLPDKFRAPLVLCYLEGMTHDQAAEHLGLAKGTLKGRLERARLLLRGRLVRLGLAPAVVLLVDACRPVGAAPAAPGASTLAQAAVAFAAGRPAGVSPQVAQLTKGALNAMLVSKLGSAAVLLGVSLLVAGSGVFVSRGASGGPPMQEEPTAQGGGAVANPGTDAARDLPWGEAVGGWRMRVSLPSGTEYRRNAPLPLSLEVQNVSGGPRSIAFLAPYADPEVSEGGERLVVRVPIDVTPWEARRDQLPAEASLKWTVDFDRLRFARQPLKAGTALRIRFRLAMLGETPEGAPDPRTHQELFSNEVSLKVRDDHPSVMASEEDLPPKWVGSMVLTYREHLGLLGYQALRIDGEGRARLVSLGRGKGKTPPIGLIRTEAVLNREHLDRLARLLRDQKVWELADLARDEIPNPDEGEIRLSVGMGHGSLVRSFPNRVVRGERKLLVLKAEMDHLMEVVRREAAAKESRQDQSPTLPSPQTGDDAKADARIDETVWGKPLNGLRLGLCRAEAKKDGQVRLHVVLENGGAEDLVVNLGLLLANGKRQLPMAVSLRVVGGDGKEHVLRLNVPGVAGRVDPFVVPLSSGNRYAVSCDLEQWGEPLAPGRYRARAEFVGEAVTKKAINTDMTGLALMPIWTGTITSGDLQVTLPARPAR